MKNFILLSLLLFPAFTLAQSSIKVATFDSGFGGYFTAKEIEKQSQDLLSTQEGNITISHYGDTANAPYGEKTPSQIADFSAKGISRAFSDGAEVVFIACNTASTQFDAIKKILNQNKPGQGERIVSIIDSSVSELKHQIDEILKVQKSANVAILATPATIRAGAYLKALSLAYKSEKKETPLQKHTQERWYQIKGKTIESVSSVATFELPNGKTIHITQMGPANWVDMIEHGAPLEIKTKNIARDLELLSGKAQWDVVGEFCTHFPAVDEIIKQQSLKLNLSTSKTVYIKQGPLMANIFREMMISRLGIKRRGRRPEPPRASIFISGDNQKETAELAKEIFPNDPAPVIRQMKF